MSDRELGCKLELCQGGDSGIYSSGTEGLAQTGAVLLDACSRKLIVVQARLGSTRLPGKVLLDLAGEPLIVRMVERVARTESGAEIVVATTKGREDDVLAGICRAAGIAVFRGHPTDLLDRHYQAALEREHTTPYIWERPERRRMSYGRAGAIIRCRIAGPSTTE